MQPLRIALIASVMIGAVTLLAEFVVSKSLTCPTSVAATSTNTTAQTATSIENMARAGPFSHMLTLQVIGEAAASGTVTVFLARSPDGVIFEDAVDSNVKIWVLAKGATAGAHCDWYNLTGTKQLRIARVENPTAGAITNIAVTISGTQ